MRFSYCRLQVLCVTAVMLIVCDATSLGRSNKPTRMRTKLTSKSDPILKSSAVASQTNTRTLSTSSSKRNYYRRKPSVSSQATTPVQSSAASDSAKEATIRKIQSKSQNRNRNKAPRPSDDLLTEGSIQVKVEQNIVPKNEEKKTKLTKIPTTTPAPLSNQNSTIPKGWHMGPTTSLPNKKLKTIDDKDKTGNCGPSVSYGIKCMMKFDQCKIDKDCPGITKCCEVGECGRLCVQPKALSDLKDIAKIKQIQKKIDSDVFSESSTTSTGLKFEDIANSDN